LTSQRGGLRFGIHVPNFGDFGDARALADLAAAAETAGWDGFFLWDHILGDATWRTPMVDPWIALTAIAMRTERIRIGPLVTALPRRRPWKVARETASLDRLSGGRLVLGVGLGFPPDAEYEHFGEDGALASRARELDEGLEIVAGLWSGEPTSFAGTHYRMRETVFLPTPVQRVGADSRPGIPVWVAVHGTSEGPRRRAARWDGVFPENPEGSRLTPAEVEALVRDIRERRSDDARFDVVVGARQADLATGELDALAAAGVTWWLESIPPNVSLDAAMELATSGPPGRRTSERSGGRGGGRSRGRSD
jgi:alkanesulfonate monooxygenase SsuD/methylene tetrahydromethanopterin reductase-like flavin-dependent oxidoreductase (luciferase family)